MNKLPTDLLASFKEAYRAAYDKDIAEDEAHEVGVRLLDTFALMLKINARTIDRSRKFDSPQVSDERVHEPTNELG